MCNTVRKHGLLKIEAYCTHMIFLFCLKAEIPDTSTPKTTGINRKDYNGSYQRSQEDLVASPKLVQIKGWLIIKKYFKVSRVI